MMSSEKAFVDLSVMTVADLFEYLLSQENFHKFLTRIV